jgi:hypothetical protein
VMLHFNMKLIRVGGHERTVVMRIYLCGCRA